MAFINRRQNSKSKRFFLTAFILLAVIAGGACFYLFFEGEKPQANLADTGDFLGRNGVVKYVATDKVSGLKTITITAEQGGITKLLFEKVNPRSKYINPVGPTEKSAQISFDAIQEGFKDGPMLLTVEVTDFSLRDWLRGNKAVVTKEVTIDTSPPKIQVLHTERYLSPGGSGIAIYKLSDSTSTHGVYVNGKQHQGFLVGDGRDDTYISYFALPYNADKFDELNITAIDKAKNKAVVPFSTVLKKIRFKRDTINVGDGFLGRKIPEFQQYYPDMQGDYLEKYLYANSTIRKQNNKKISDLCASTSPRRLWNGHFLRMAGSSRAGFADHRTYRYRGKEVDNQVHLGMDIASTRRAEVKAANKGKVVFCDYLGIYGNMILLDHGQGVFSLYSHLSQINVARDETVEQGAVIGLTGTTGMAGGDHLHFSMLVNGVFVTPKEWWDKQWISVTIEEPIIDSKF